MPSVTLTVLPPPFSCIVCQRPEWREKAGPSCMNCPAFKDTHYYPVNVGPEAADLIVVGDSPIPPPIVQLIAGREVPVDRSSYHVAFEDTAGRVVREAVRRVASRREFAGINVAFTYAVKCACDKPKNETIKSCSGYLRGLIRKAHEARRADGKTSPLVVLACGKAVLDSLGVHVKKEEDAHSRVFEDVNIDGIKIQVAYTRSFSVYNTQDGKFNNLMFDVERAMKIATETTVRASDRAVLEENYVYPKTIEEVRSLIDHIISYTEGDTPASNWKVAIDTETNTLNPNGDATKLLMVSLAWTKGKAAAITLWHSECTYDPNEAFQEVKRLIASGKPLIWWNAKYDYKVFWKYGWPQGDVGNIFWDGFLAEHVLEEDNKGSYSLKAVTKKWLPAYAGYEDKLHDLLESSNDEEDDELEVEDEEDSLESELATALETCIKAKLIKSDAFQARTIEKYLADASKAEFHDTLRFLMNAKKAGEFRKSTKKKVEERTGGFENIPLNELAFYAAVDTDVTRQLTVIQIKRMGAEEEDFKKRRLREKERQRWNPAAKSFPTESPCVEARPSYTLLQRDQLPRMRELAKMEYNGTAIDLDYLKKSIVDLGATIDTTRKQVWDLCQHEFKLGSPTALAQHLFGMGYHYPDAAKAEELARQYPEDVRYQDGLLAYTPRAFTKTYRIQTSDRVLKALVARFEDPLANAILSHKKADKARGTFLVNIDYLARYFGDKKLHPGFNQTGTSTGRLSSGVRIASARFNAQNIPKGYIGALKDLAGNLILDAEGHAIFEGVNCKKLFISDCLDDLICNGDAKGAEVTVLSAYCNDKALIQALNDGLDAHSFFGSQCLNPELVAQGLTGEARRQALAKADIDDTHGWTYEDFLLGKDDKHPDKAYGKRLKKHRDNIKRLVFGMLYGAGVTKIAEIAGISLALAKQIQELLFKKFPAIRVYMEETKMMMRKLGFVETFHGRRRRFFIGENAPGEIRSKAERRAVNFLVQGTNSDIVMTVLVWLAEVIERDMRGRLLLTVHDSVVAQVPKQYVNQLNDVFREVGTKRVAKACPWLPAPYRWDVEVGDSYGEVMGVEKYLNRDKVQAQSGLDGFVEEEMLDLLRDPDSIELAEHSRPKVK